ncbi:hypothetical protein NBRC116601_28410 [Cognatishimia sp. WU-CL00825]|uniref:hypothetical protein n=1 Tax=Cognatishimia sp. WU-CL00825 TaxID=3127658 RepID=UPI0031083021
MRSVLVGFALFALTGCQTTTASVAAQNVNGSAAFSKMQSQMAASVFKDVCVDTLPNFNEAEAELRKIGAKQVGKIWRLGGGAAVFSIQTTNGRKGCVATVQETKNFEMLNALSKALKDPALPLRAGKLGKNLAFLANTRGGPALIVFTPNTQKSTASTFWIEAKDTN